MNSSPLDFNQLVFSQDPYPAYARLRRDAPVSRARMTIVPSRKPRYVLTRYEDVHATLKDDERFASNKRSVAGAPTSSWWTPRLFEMFEHSMAFSDGIEHQRLRNTVHAAFTPARVRALGATIETITTELLERALIKREVDLIADFALPLPLRVISEMLGVPASGQLVFHRWTTSFLEESGSPVVKAARLVVSGLSMMRFFRRLIRLRTREPGSDIVSALIFRAGDRQAPQ